MRLSRLLCIGWLTALACGCTQRIELANPIIAVYWPMWKPVTCTGYYILIYYRGAIGLAKEPYCNGTPPVRSRMPMDSVNALLRHAHSIDFFDREVVIKYEPASPSRDSYLDMQEPRMIRYEYMIRLDIEGEWRAVVIYPDSPIELREFGERIKRIAEGASREAAIDR